MSSVANAYFLLTQICSCRVSITGTPFVAIIKKSIYISLNLFIYLWP